MYDLVREGRDGRTTGRVRVAETEKKEDDVVAFGFCFLLFRVGEVGVLFFFPLSGKNK
jgi:hypothetical protein